MGALILTVMLACAGQPSAEVDTAADIADSASPGASPTLESPDLPAEPGEYAVELGWEAEERKAVVVVPTTYDASAAQPLVVVLHGGSGGALGYRDKRQGLVDAAEEAGVVLVFPGGSLSQDGTGHVWNAWDKPQTPADDVGFLSALIDWVVGELALDAERVFLSGFSNGAAMTQRFAAERPEEIAAIAALCHSVWTHEPASDGPELCDCEATCSESCPVVETGDRYDLPTPMGPTPALLIRGGDDPRICSSGGCGSTGKESGSVEDQLRFWLGSNGCSETPTSEASIFDAATMRRFEDCSGALVVQVFDGDLSHTWSSRYDAPVLEFFLAQ